MKRKISFTAALLLLAALAAAVFAGCGKAANTAVSSKSEPLGYDGEAEESSVSRDSSVDGGYEYIEKSGGYGSASASDIKPQPAPGEAQPTNSASVLTVQQGAVSGDKIIYTGYAEIETLEFDKTVESVYKMIDRYGGFLESSYVTGNDYKTQHYKSASYRTAHFVARIPKDRFSEMQNGLSELGNVTYTSTQAQNVTAQYTDTESQLKAYRTEEERLLKILEKADTVADMITIEDRLSQVRYNIESLTTQLNAWDSRISYSTLELSVSEVQEFSDEPVLAKTFWEEIAGGVSGSLKWLVKACKRAVIIIASALPLLAVPAVIAAVVWLAVRSRRKKAGRESGGGNGDKQA